MRGFALICFVVFSYLNCAQKTDCRKYATQIARNDGGRIYCDFNEKTARKHCVGGSVISDYAYRSLGDFIDEGRIIGRRLWVTLLVSGSLTKRTDNFLSSDSRILSAVDTQDATTKVSTPQEWDSLHRPLRQIVDFNSGTGSSCNGMVETTQFDDGALTIADQVSYAQSVGTGSLAGTPCATAVDSTYSYRYDSDKELIATNTYTYTLLAKAEVCQ
jgi:hypothetical protein